MTDAGPERSSQIKTDKRPRPGPAKGGFVRAVSVGRSGGSQVAVGCGCGCGRLASRHKGEEPLFSPLGCQGRGRDTGTSEGRGGGRESYFRMGNTGKFRC